MIRLAVVADSPLVQAGLEALVAGDADVQIVRGVLIGSDDGANMSPWERAAGLGPDVILWAPASPADVLPALDHAAEDAGPGTFGDAGAGLPALVIVADVPTADVVEALRAGVRAVLPTASAAPAVTAAVQAAAAGLVTLRPQDADAALARTPGDPRADAPAPAARPTTPGVLSAREREVLALMAEGLANKQIAGRLGISEHTVKAHVAAIFGKLGAGTRAEAVVTAARRGLLML